MKIDPNSKQTAVSCVLFKYLLSLIVKIKVLIKLAKVLYFVYFKIFVCLMYVDKKKYLFSLSGCVKVNVISCFYQSVNECHALYFMISP